MWSFRGGMSLLTGIIAILKHLLIEMLHVDQPPGALHLAG